MAKTNAHWVKPKNEHTSSVLQRILITKDFDTEKADTLFADVQVVESFTEGEEVKSMILLINRSYVLAHVGQWLLTKSPDSISLVTHGTGQNYIVVEPSKK